MNMTQNSSLLNNSPFFKESVALVIARLTFASSLALVGVVGNILVCVVIVSKKLRGRSPMHFYLLSLALADLGVLVFIYPIGVIKERQPRHWPLGRFICLYLYPCIDTFFGASIWFITAIAFQRYQNIVRNKELHRPHKSAKQVICEILVIWAISFLVIALPLYFVYEYKEVGKDVILCKANWNKSPHQWLLTAHNLTLVFFSYLLPLVVVSWTYVGIWREIRKSIIFHKNLEKESGSSKAKESRRSGENARARKILTPIVITFALTMLPLNAFRVLSIFWPQMFMLRHFWTLHYFVVIVTVTNSAINPIIYSVVSKDFRKAFLQLMMKKEGKPGVQTATFLLSRSRSDRHDSFTQSKQKPQPAVISKEKWPSPDTLQETNL